VPEDFRFALKVPKTITHERRLKDVGDPLDWFLSDVGGLGAKLGPLMVSGTRQVRRVGKAPIRSKFVHGFRQRRREP
jgi:hypothetical protein